MSGLLPTEEEREKVTSTNFCAQVLRDSGSYPRSRTGRRRGAQEIVPLEATFRGEQKVISRSFQAKNDLERPPALPSQPCFERPDSLMYAPGPTRSHLAPTNHARAISILLLLSLTINSQFISFKNER